MTHGIKVFDGFGANKLGPDTKIFRAIARINLNEGDSGSINLPNFDSNNGYITEQIGKRSVSSLGYSWDNSSKILSWSNANADGTITVFGVG